MKRILTALFLLFAVYAPAWGQTITIDSISGTSFCAGDPISVTFTVTGTWGDKNAFTLQLSNDTGGFNNFDNGVTNLGSVKDTAPGSFSIVTSIPPPTPYSSHYRLRIISGDLVDPPIASNPGGYIHIGETPSNLGWFHPLSAIAVNDPFGFNFMYTATMPNPNDTSYQPVSPYDTVYLDFGAGASPADSIMSTSKVNENPVVVTYSTGGLKTITLRVVGEGGCSVSDTFQIYVYDCTNPVIPHDAVIISDNTIFNNNNESNKAFWVDPGVSLGLGDNVSDTIFAEIGSSISSGPGDLTGDIVYIKTQATCTADFDGVVVYDSGAYVTTTGTEVQTVECTDLTFDYSVAPPNVVMGINVNESVTPAAPAAEIEVSPNPTSGTITLENVPAYASVTAMNVLGETVTQTKAPGSGTMQLDLTQSSPGTYYIRIASGTSVVTKAIVKE